MLTLKKLELALKKKYNTVVGQKTLTELKQKILKVKVKASGRYLKTGKKKTINLSIKDLI